jgi:hypothetical protein
MLCFFLHLKFIICTFYNIYFLIHNFLKYSGTKISWVFPFFPADFRSGR